MRSTWLMGLVVIGCADAAGTTDAPPDASLPVPDAMPDTAPVVPPLPSVTQHHNEPTRNGVYVVPGLTRQRVGTLHLDVNFQAHFKGAVNAQPLFVASGPAGHGAVYVVTESNDVIAFATDDGKLLWTGNMGPAAAEMNDGCPATIPGGLGITSTPLIDLTTRTLYIDAVLGQANSQGKVQLKTHLVHGLSIDDGTERPGWPVDPTGLTSNGNTFDPTVQHQRGALALIGGVLYVPYGSLGDCGPYHGWVVGISVSDPTQRSAWSTPGPLGGIWAPSGVTSDGVNVFFATGNGGGAGPDGGPGTWGGGESMFRFKAGVPLSANPDDTFTVADWALLDGNDEDLGGSGVLLVSLPGSTPAELALALGKDGNLYMLDAANLGGADGGGLQQLPVAKNIVDAPAVVPNDKGAMVVFDAQSGGQGVGCPAGQGGDLVGVQITAGSPPTAAVAWCADNEGHGSPMITTTDGRSDAMVWITADATSALRGYDAQTGAVIFAGPPELTGLRRFNTLIYGGLRFLIATDTGVYGYLP